MSDDHDNATRPCETVLLIIKFDRDITALRSPAPLPIHRLISTPFGDLNARADRANEPYPLGIFASPHGVILRLKNKHRVRGNLSHCSRLQVAIRSIRIQRHQVVIRCLGTLPAPRPSANASAFESGEKRDWGAHRHRDRAAKLITHVWLAWS